MKNGFLKRAVALASAVVLTAMGTMMVSAADIQPIQKESTITLHLYASNRQAGEVGTGTTGDAAQLPEEAKPLSGATFQYAQVGEVVQYNDGKEAGIRYKITNEEFAKALGITATEVPVVENNYYVVPDTLLQKKMAANTSAENVAKLIDSLKKICQTSTGETDQAGAVSVAGAKGLYAFIGGTMPETVISQVVPFLVSAPMPNLTGDGWNTDVHVYPKVQDSFVKLEKTASQNGVTADNILVQSGDKIEYEVKTVIPGGAGVGAIADLSKLIIKDTMAVGLKPIQGESSLVITDKNGVPQEFTVKKDQQGTQDLEVTAPSNENLNTTTVTFTETGLAKLNKMLESGDATVTLKYKAILSGNAELGYKGNENRAVLDYQRKGVEGSTIEDSSKVYTYGIDLTKELSDGAAVTADTIRFALSRQTANGSVERLSFTKGDDGIYWVVGDSDDMKDAEKVEEMSVPEGGNLKIYGLLPGAYELVETKSARGYSILDHAIKIVITEPESSASYGTVNATATADGQKMETDSANAFKLKVVNTKQTTGFSLPKTGGAGTIVAIATGFGLICFAVFMLVFYRTKNRNTDAK